MFCEIESRSDRSRCDIGQQASGEDRHLFFVQGLAGRTIDLGLFAKPSDELTKLQLVDLCSDRRPRFREPLVHIDVCTGQPRVRSGLVRFREEHPLLFGDKDMLSRFAPRSHAHFTSRDRLIHQLFDRAFEVWIEQCQPHAISIGIAGGHLEIEVAEQQILRHPAVTVASDLIAETGHATCQVLHPRTRKTRIEGCRFAGRILLAHVSHQRVHLARSHRLTA